MGRKVPKNQQYFYDRTKRVQGPLETQCWEWQRGTFPNGYGSVTIDGKATPAHRVAFSVFVGKIPAGRYVCHKCDNPLCCNPDHLFVGTPGDNMKDMANKDRHTFGERSARSKLTEKQVEEIRSSGLLGRELAEQYGVAISTIYTVRRRETWKHV